jgi:hypothetical protein
MPTHYAARNVINPDKLSGLTPHARLNDFVILVANRCVCFFGAAHLDRHRLEDLKGCPIF